MADIKQMQIATAVIFRRNVKNSVKQEFLILTDDFSNSSSTRFHVIWNGCCLVFIRWCGKVSLKSIFAISRADCPPCLFPFFCCFTRGSRVFIIVGIFVVTNRTFAEISSASSISQISFPQCSIALFAAIRRIKKPFGFTSATNWEP